MHKAAAMQIISLFIVVNAITLLQSYSFLPNYREKSRVFVEKCLK